MTIVVTYASHPIVMQVADRRLTFPDGSLADDNTTKSILWNDSWLISFTGLAKVDGLPTHRWIAKILAEHDRHLEKDYLDRSLAALGKVIGDRIRAQPIHQDHKRLAIIGVGWGLPWDVAAPPPSGLRAYAWHLSNFLDASGEPTDTVRRSFDFAIFRGRPFQKSEMGVLTHGQELKKSEWSRLCRLLRKSRPRCAGPAPAARLIVDAVQRINSPRVSKTLLIACLPLPHLQHGSVVLNCPPNSAGPSFWYVDPGGEWRLQYGPIVVSGGSIIEAVEIRYGEAVSWSRNR